MREPYAVEVPYSIHQPVDRPLGSTVPPTFAADGPIEHAGAVTTSGAPRVVKRHVRAAARAGRVRGDEAVVVRDARLEARSCSDTSTAVVPLPALCAAVREP